MPGEIDPEMHNPQENLIEGKPRSLCYRSTQGNALGNEGEKQSIKGAQAKFRLIILKATIYELWKQWKILNPEWKANMTSAIVSLLPLIKARGPAPVYTTNIQLKIPKDSSNCFSRKGKGGDAS